MKHANINNIPTYLPAYAPELNPVEYLWGYWKQHELPNVCPRDYWELDDSRAPDVETHPASPTHPRGVLAAVPLGVELTYIMRNSIMDLAVRTCSKLFSYYRKISE